MPNHLGSYECKLCLTLHSNEGSYLAHTQGKKHQDNLARRAAREARDAPAQPAPEKARVSVREFVKIGRPGYRVTKQRDPETRQQSLLFQVCREVVWIIGEMKGEIHASECFLHIPRSVPKLYCG